MAETPQVNIRVVNNLTPQTDPSDFIAFVSGVTLRGKVNTPDKVISSWPEFVKIYGSYSTDSDFPHLCKRMLDRGTKLRVARAGHYTTIGNASTLTATKPTLFIKTTTFSIDAAMEAGDTFTLIIGDWYQTFYFYGTHAATMMSMASTAQTAAGSAITIDFTADSDGGELLFVMADDAEVFGVIQGEGADPVITITNVNTASTITDGTDDLFSIEVLGEGKDGNYLSIEISDASNGQWNAFNLTLRHSQEPDLTELYENLLILNTPTIETSTFLSGILLDSNFIKPVYIDLSTLTGPLRPVNAIYTFGGAIPGGAIIDVDYVGDASAGNGIHCFDDYDDGYLISTPELSSSAVNVALQTYAASRKDLIAICHLPETLKTSDGLIAEKNTWNLDSVFAIPVGGGLNVLNPISQVQESISEAADLIGCMAYTFTEFFPWFSPFGKNRGVIPNVLGPTVDFGSMGKFNDLNDLARKQINMVISRDNRVYFQNNTNGRVLNDAYQQVSVAMGLQYMKKILRPILENFLDEPADIPTMVRLHKTVLPTLENWLRDRAYTEYVWNGDQGAKTTADFQINNANDVQNGKYKIQFAVKPIGALKLINLDIMLSDAGVQFN